MAKYIMTYEWIGGQLVYKKYHEDGQGRISAKDSKALKSGNPKNGAKGCHRLYQRLFSDIIPDKKIARPGKS